MLTLPSFALRAASVECALVGIGFTGGGWAGPRGTRPWISTGALPWALSRSIGRYDIELRRCALRQCPDVLASVAGSMVCGSNSWSNGYHSAPPPFCRHRLPPPAAATLALLPLICRRQPCHHSQPRRRHPQCRRRHAPSPPPLCTARSHECAERSWQLLSWANPPMKLRLRGGQVYSNRVRAPCPALEPPPLVHVLTA